VIYTIYETSKILAELGFSQDLKMYDKYYAHWNHLVEQIGMKKAELQTYTSNRLVLISRENMYYRAYDFHELWEMLPTYIFTVYDTYDLYIDKSYAGYDLIAEVIFKDYPNEADALAHLIKQLVNKGHMEVK